MIGVWRSTLPSRDQSAGDVQVLDDPRLWPGEVTDAARLFVDRHAELLRRLHDREVIPRLEDGQGGRDQQGVRAVPSDHNRLVAGHYRLTAPYYGPGTTSSPAIRKWWSNVKARRSLRRFMRTNETQSVKLTSWSW